MGPLTDIQDNIEKLRSLQESLHDLCAFISTLDLTSGAKEETLIHGITELKEAFANIDLSSVEQAIIDVKNAVTNIDFSTLAKEETLLTKVAELKEALNTIDFTDIEQAIQNVENVTAREATLIQGAADIIKAVENIDFTDLEKSIADVKNAVINIDFSAIAKEATLTHGVNVISQKIDDIHIPELDKSDLAKEATLSSGISTLSNKIDNIDLSSVENKVDEGVKTLSNKIDNIDLTSVESKVEEESQAIQGKIDGLTDSLVVNPVAKESTIIDESQSIKNKIDNIKLPEIDTTELAKESTLQEVKSSVEGISVPLSAISGLALELEGGKKNIANALKARGVESSVNTDTLTDMAAKVYEVKNPVAFTVPVEASNELANMIFNNMMKSQGYEKMYAEVVKTYCGEGGAYVGCLMTSLIIGKNTSILLTGADAYYIYEENIFYKSGANGNLVQFLNGQEVQLSSKYHIYNTMEIVRPLRTIFYLYIQDSVANGDRENAHLSLIDFCQNTTIPTIQYKSNCGIFLHFHVSNPESCTIKWNGGAKVNSTSNARTIYLYSNIHNADEQIALNGNNTTMSYVNLEGLKTVNGGVVCNSTLINSLEFPNLEVIKNAILINGLPKNNIRLSFPSLKEVTKGTLYWYKNNPEYPIEYIEVNLPSIELIDFNNSPNMWTTGAIICDKVKEYKFILKDGVKIFGLVGAASQINVPEIVRIVCKEIYSTRNDVSEKLNYYPCIYGRNLYFEGLKKAKLNLGAGSSYTNEIDYIYINCIGDRDDSIELYYYTVYDSVNNLTDIEISHGTRQPLTFYSFGLLTPDNIVNHIFERLADNRFEDDGVTPAPAIKITLGSKNLAKLTDAQKAVATDKNYILA